MLRRHPLRLNWPAAFLASSASVISTYAQAQPTCNVEQAGAMSAAAARSCLLQMARQAEPDCRTTLPFYKAAGEMEMKPKLLALIAECHLKLGDYDTAMAQAERCLVEFQGEDKATLASCEEIKAAAEPYFGHLVVVTRAPPQGLRVFVNGAAVSEGQAAGPIRLKSGPVKLEAFAPGYVPHARIFDLASGAPHYEEILLSRESQPPAALPSALPQQSPGTDSTAGDSLGGVADADRSAKMLDLSAGASVGVRTIGQVSYSMCAIAAGVATPGLGATWGTLRPVAQFRLEGVSSSSFCDIAADAPKVMIFSAGAVARFNVFDWLLSQASVTGGAAKIDSIGPELFVTGREDKGYAGSDWGASGEVGIELGYFLVQGARFQLAVGAAGQVGVTSWAPTLEFAGQTEFPTPVGMRSMYYGGGAVVRIGWSPWSDASGGSP